VILNSRRGPSEAGTRRKDFIAAPYLPATYDPALIEPVALARADHASYIANWLEVLKNDKRAIFTAASHAQRAADYLHNLQQPAEAMSAAA
jgi:antirestriction protein ArdC